MTEPNEQVMQVLGQVMSELVEIKKLQSNVEERLAQINDEIQKKVETHSEGIFERLKAYFIHSKEASDSPEPAYGSGTVQKESGSDPKGPPYGSGAPTPTPGAGYGSGGASQAYGSSPQGTGYGSSASSPQYGSGASQPAGEYAELEAARKLKQYCQDGLNQLCEIEQSPQGKGAAPAIDTLKKTMAEYAAQDPKVLAQKGKIYLDSRYNVICGGMTGLIRRLKFKDETKEKPGPRMQAIVA